MVQEQVQGPVVGRVPAELAAAVLALAGVRGGDCVLDLLPAAGLAGGAAAAAGPRGRVVALVGTDSVVGVVGMDSIDGHQHLPDGIETVTDLGALADESVAKVLAIDPTAAARSLAPLLVAVRPLLAPGARVTVASAPNTGMLTEGLPSVLAACGLVVVHAEGLAVSSLPAGRVALAVGRAAGMAGAAP